MKARRGLDIEYYRCRHGHRWTTGWASNRRDEARRDICRDCPIVEWGVEYSYLPLKQPEKKVTRIHG